MWQASSEEEALTSLGLTLSQAKVYLTLAKRGPLKVASISQASKIRREHLYGLLKSLERKGLVEKELGVTIVYAAAPLNVTLPMLVKDKQLEFSKLEKNISSLVANYEKEKVQSTTFTQFKPEICVASNRNRILNKVQVYFEAAKVQVDLAHTWKRFVQFWDHYEDTLGEAMRRGVRVRQIVEFPFEEKQPDDSLLREVFTNRMFELKLSPSVGGNFAVLDMEKMFMSSTCSRGKFAQTPLIFSNYEGFIGILQNYFELSWRNSCRWTLGKSLVELMATLPKPS